MKMPNKTVNNRFLFFGSMEILRVALSVRMHLFGCSVYSLAQRMSFIFFDLLPEQIVSNPWQIILVVTILK